MKKIYLAILVLLFVSCVTGNSGSPPASRDYREDMREFVRNISASAKNSSAGFLIVPQNGQELFTISGDPAGSVASSYIAAIDGTGREDLFYGYTIDDEATPDSENEWMRSFLEIGETYGIEALVTDYCSTHWKVDSSYARNQECGYISFAADHRGLDNIPEYPQDPWNVNTADITDLEGARNFLYIIDPGQFTSLQEFINALAATKYDIIIIDLFYNDQQLASQDIDQLRNKPQGGSRVILAYMSIGEAEDYRYYWQPDWTSSPPSWLSSENPDWPGNYLVRYWNSDWQAIIFGTDDSYLGRILDSGFDGVYLDKIDSFEDWEEI